MTTKSTEIREMIEQEQGTPYFRKTAMLRILDALNRRMDEMEAKLPKERTPEQYNAVVDD